MVVVINAVPVTSRGLTSRQVFIHIIDRYIPAHVSDTVSVGPQHDSGDVFANVVRVTLGDHHDDVAFHDPFALHCLLSDA